MGYAVGGLQGRHIFFLPRRDDFQRAIRQRPLELQRRISRRRHPRLNLFGLCKDHRDCLGVNGADHVVRIGGQEIKQRALAFHGVSFRAALECQVVQMPAKTHSGRLSSSANQVGVFFGFGSAYS
jgi:hypothetical protein